MIAGSQRRAQRRFTHHRSADDVEIFQRIAMRSRVMDLRIAATAHVRDTRLYTRNAESLKGLAARFEIVSV